MRATPVSPHRGITAKSEAFAFLELLAATWLAVAQPLLDTFQRGAETFVFRRASAFDVVAFTLIITFGPALLFYLLEVSVGLIDGRARVWTHRLLIALAVGVFAAELGIRWFDGHPALYWTLALVAAVATLALLTWVRPTQVFLRFLSIAPFAFAALFLFASPVSQMAFADGARTAEGITIDDPPPIVMVVFDELPTASLLGPGGTVDADLFPNVAAFADDATWYRNYSTVSPTTPEAVPALLTGNYPDEIDRLPTSSSHPDNLFTLLEGAYEMNVWEQATQLCPPETCPEAGTASATGLVALLDDARDVWGDLLTVPTDADADEAFKVRQSDPVAPDRFNDFIASLADHDAPRLDFLHILLPHQPWRHLPSGARHNGEFIAEGLDEGYRWRDEFFPDAARQRHLLQLERTDRLFGDLLDRLRELDRYDESLIIVTADHGVSFAEGEPIRGVSEGNQEQTMWTPLLIKTPGQDAAAIDEVPMQSVDLLPTLADLLGVTLPWTVDGTSAVDRDADPDDDLRRIYRWKGFSDIELFPGEDYALVDGREQYDALLDVEPWPTLRDGDLRLYAFGRYGALVGRDIDELEVGEPASFTGEIGDPDATLKSDAVHLDLDNVDVSADVLPSYLRGVLDTDDAADVVVTVNGIVAGWSPAFIDTKQDEGTRSFFVLAPEQLFNQGPNDIGVYTVTGTADAPLLRPVELR